MSKIISPEFMMTDQNEEMKAKLNAETGKLVWQELEKHYARGVVVKVSTDLDLIEVAICFAEDNKESIEKWLTSGELERAMEEDAVRWGKDEPLFWAVVVAPWILAQEIETPDSLH
jgi:hypothetical protein